MKRSYPRCAMTCQDGTQCGRRVADGSNPPICHIHAGRNGSPIIPSPDEVDPIKILVKLARDKNARVRLRAADLLLSLKAKSQLADAGPNYRDFVAALTDDERERIERAIRGINEVKMEVYRRRPDLAPEKIRLRPPEVSTDDPKQPPVSVPDPPVPTKPRKAHRAVDIDGVVYLDGVDE